MEVLDIPTNAVGKLIGKAGETIRNLQLTTDTRIQVPPPGVDGWPPGAPPPLCRMRAAAWARLNREAQCRERQPPDGWGWEALYRHVRPASACLGHEAHPCALLSFGAPPTLYQVDHAGEGDTKRVTITGMSA